MKLIGHRGACGLAPENTLASVKKALEYAVDEIEIDVRLSSDGVVVLHHDPYIVTADRRDLSIRYTPYAELLRRAPDLVALDHVVRAVAHRARLMIEIKPGVPVKPIATIIADRLQRGWRLSEFCVASSDLCVLRAAREALPGVELVVIEKWSGVRATSRARRLNTRRISINQRWLWYGFVRTMHSRGFQLSPYTLNNPRRAARWQRYLYGVITDRPDRYHSRKKHSRS
jgi:glycerophosphoryl diester phosphodiesterase